MCIRIVACKISGMLFINRGEMRAILSYQYHMISHPAVGMLNQNPPMHFLGWAICLNGMSFTAQMCSPGPGGECLDQSIAVAVRHKNFSIISL